MVPASAHPRGAAHLSAASALVRIGPRLHAVADDELHLASFAASARSGIVLTRLFETALPDDPVARKRRKPDLEALLRVPAFDGAASRPAPGSVLLALGSGSRPTRERGAWVSVDPLSGEVQGPATAVDLAPLYARLRPDFAELNVEGAFWIAGELRLLHRAHPGDPRNACIRYAWDAIAPFLGGAGDAPDPRAVTTIELGDVDGVSWGWTDATPLAAGGWAFCAAAEATADAYADGPVHGSALGIVDADDRLVSFELLSRRWKVEGIAEAGPPAEGFCLVSDADDPAQPSWLLRATRRP